MAISLSDIKRSTLGPPRIVLYGVPGIGKTTEASFAPKPIFLPVEDGLGQLDVPTFPQPKDYSEVASAIDTLLNEGLITTEQASRFHQDGALGSHLEILERNDGYKGFNQTGINDIIRRTDPRAQR